MKIHANEISALIKEQIKNYRHKIDSNDVGTVVSVGDGIANVYGLEKAMLGELLLFPNDVYGMVMNLDSDSVGVVLLGNDNLVKEGDLVSVDTVALKNGFNGDAARTFICGGKTSKDAQRLVDVTKSAFYEGIKYAKPGNRIGDISHAIGEFVRENGYSVVREFEGHGIGRQMHEAPGIPNYGKAGRGPRIEPGMTLAVEPMVIQGKPNILELDDGWTIVTEDGSLAAHYENTILITENEPKILTIKKKCYII